jgi:hypothetical protein
MNWEIVYHSFGLVGSALHLLPGAEGIQLRDLASF